MPLKGIKVLEFVGLAPGPFCGKILADFGASVTRIDKSLEGIDCLRSGKRTLAIDLKRSESQRLIKLLSLKYDVLLEPFRPGVMERLNLGPDVLMASNPRLIYARLTGFGQAGPLALRAGHDINYLALSGVLSRLGRKAENPTAPVNLLADFAGGGLTCALGICLALIERHKSGKGQLVDSAMVDGAAYIASWLAYSQKSPWWGQPRGENLLDTGAFFYDTYKTKDGKFMSVGALEDQFYRKFVEKLGFDLDDLPQHSDNEKAKNVVAERFLTKTQKEWSDIFEDCDACVYPVLEFDAAWEHDHNKSRGTFFKTSKNISVAQPAPKLSRTPGRIRENDDANENAFEIASEILKEVGESEDSVRKLCEEGVIRINIGSKL